MALEPGYNFVRAGALRQFQQDFRRRYPSDEMTEISVVAFLRLLQHRQRPPHRCLLVHGMDRLWPVCEEGEPLRMRLKELLTLRASWIREQFGSVYFLLPAEVEFVHSRTVQLRLTKHEHELVDLDLLFGGTPTQSEPDHFNRPFSMS